MFEFNNNIIYVINVCFNCFSLNVDVVYEAK